MIAPIAHFKGARQPPLYGQILVDGAPVDLTGATVTFYMRESSSAVLKVSGAAATVDNAATGSVHYSWAAADVDTSGYWIGWWRVTSGGQYEDTPEFLITIVDHDAEVAEYVSVQELKSTRQIGKDFADADVRLAVAAASRAVDALCGRSFTLGPSTTRYYTPIAPDYVLIDDAAAITAVSVSGTAWVAVTDYNAEAQMYGWPYSIVRSVSGVGFTRYAPNSVAVTGTFGWASVPTQIKVATVIIASRLVQLMREGSIVGLGFDGSAIALGLEDANIDVLVAPFRRSSMEA